MATTKMFEIDLTALTAEELAHLFLATRRHIGTFDQLGIQAAGSANIGFEEFPHLVNQIEEAVQLID